MEVEFDMNGILTTSVNKKNIFLHNFEPIQLYSVF